MKSKLITIASIANIVIFIIYLFAFTTKENNSILNLEDKIIKVRGVVVVDSLGIERVIVGSHLPEPNFANGNRVKARGKNGSVSGLMLYDSEGQERGGYVTDDGYGNAFLTLDSKTSQQFLLLAEPQGAASMMIFNRNGKNKISMTASDDTAYMQLKYNNKYVNLYSHEK